MATTFTYKNRPHTLSFTAARMTNNCGYAHCSDIYLQRNGVYVDLTDMQELVDSDEFITAFKSEFSRGVQYPTCGLFFSARINKEILPGTTGCFMRAMMNSKRHNVVMLPPMINAAHTPISRLWTFGRPDSVVMCMFLVLGPDTDLLLTDTPACNMRPPVMDVSRTEWAKPAFKAACSKIRAAWNLEIDVDGRFKNTRKNTSTVPTGGTEQQAPVPEVQWG